MEVYTIGGKPLMLDGKLCKVAAGGQETWVLNENPDLSSKFDYIINFNSNDTEFTRIRSGGVLAPGATNHDLIYLNATEHPAVVYSGEFNRWYDQAYRTITFLEPPTGELLTWLQANGVKQ